MKWNWYIPMSAAQFEKLKAGLKSRYRFQLRLAVETVTYNNGIVTVRIPAGIKPDNIQDQISDYINGFSQAIS